MRWKDFTARVEALGITDDTELGRIDVDQGVSVEELRVRADLARPHVMTIGWQYDPQAGYHAAIAEEL